MRLSENDGLTFVAEKNFQLLYLDEVSCGGNSGFCAAPNQCTCAKNYAQNSDDGGCHSMRTAGLKGAACSLVVIITAITICGTIQSQREKAGKIQT